ncbi:MAG: HesA/MoeB/ThiF family protein [Chloroflexota bacterium]|nr:HesA/MoeB/ThiF family protein [Chloroflexota bacterium]
MEKRLRQLATIAPEEQGLPLLSLKAVRQVAQEFGLAPREVEILALKERILPARYLRSLGTIGWEGQIRLLQATVAVIGLGGLGGNIVEGLARAGIGHLILIDPDTFVEHNLNRQVLSTEANLGASKVEMARARVAEINSVVGVTTHAVEATAENLPRLLEGADVVVDALDRLPTRLTLQDAAQSLGIPMVHGAIGGMTGQVMTIFPGDEGLYALYGRGEVPERGIEVQQGCPTATPMMVAAWQVQEVLKILLNKGEPLRHRMLLMDAEAGAVDVIRLGMGESGEVQGH